MLMLTCCAKYCSYRLSSLSLSLSILQCFVPPYSSICKTPGKEISRYKCFNPNTHVPHTAPGVATHGGLIRRRRLTSPWNQAMLQFAIHVNQTRAPADTSRNSWMLPPYDPKPGQTKHSGDAAPTFLFMTTKQDKTKNHGVFDVLPFFA